MDLWVIKYMIFYGVSFDTYEVISPCNVHLGDYSIAKMIWMGSIVVEVERGGKTNRIYIEDVLYVSKLQANLLSVK